MARAPAKRTGGTTAHLILHLIDRWGIQATTGVVALVWLSADIFGFEISKGTEAALGAWVAYGVLQMRRDGTWRAVEGEAKELKALKESVDTLAEVDPESPEGRAAAVKVVAAAKAKAKAKPKKKTDGEK